MDPDRVSRVLYDVAGFIARIAAAGALNSLSQTLLRLTSPGVPDLYQGTEYWDFSLVDPDNRRPVDFPARQKSLAESRSPAELLGHWRDGRVKQAVIARALRFRAEAGELFTQGSYTPLKVEGEKADHVLAFARVHEGRAAIVAVTRLAANLPGVADAPRVTPECFNGTFLTIPRNFVTRRSLDVLMAQDRGGEGLTGQMAVNDLFAGLPVALLEVR